MAVRQCVPAILLAILGGCAGAKMSPLDETPRFPGTVVADEPQAARVGREVLAAGGTAGDAVAAMGLALAVTRPDAAGLGAGGVCVLVDQARKQTLAVTFLPAPGIQGAGPVPAVAPPALAAGMAALHASQGKLRWARIVAPAEAMAEFGEPLSRGTAQALAAGAAIIRADPEARRIFAPDGSNPAGEGAVIQQPQLAALLREIRLEGAAALQRGPLARRFVAAVRAVGGALGDEDVAVFWPKLADTLTIRAGNNDIHLAPAEGGAGGFQALLASLLLRGDRFVDARADERPHLLADAEQRARAAGLAAGIQREQVDRLLANYRPNGRTAPAPPNPALEASGVAFLAVDGDGSAAACGVSLGRPFGLARVAPGTGVFPALALSAGETRTALSPVLVVNRATRVFFMAAAGMGAGAPAILTAMAVEAAEGGRALERLLAVPRLAVGGEGGEILVETGTPAGIAGSLAARGYAVRDGGILAGVQVVACADGLPRSPETCAARADPRGHGIALSAADPATRRR